MSIRRAEISDLLAMARLDALASANPWSGEQWQREILGSHAEVWVWESFGIAGWIVVWRIADEVQIANVAVSPDHRRKGGALQLLDFVLDRAQNQNARRATLEVRANNTAALALYLKRGFQLVGRREKYYDGVTDALLMEKIF